MDLRLGSFRPSLQQIKITPFISLRNVRSVQGSEASFVARWLRLRLPLRLSFS